MPTITCYLSLVFALGLLGSCPSWAAEAQPLTAGAQFAACDSLQIGQDDSSDARLCLQGLAWPAAEFAVTLEPPQVPHGDWLVRFPSARPSGEGINDQVAVEWYQVRDDTGQVAQAPAAVILHESGSGMTVGRLLAKALRARGIHSFLVQLPYYGVRRPNSSKPTGEKLAEALCQSVCDARRAYDAVTCLPGVDADRISLHGISLGGFVTATTAGLDRAYQQVFVLLAGGDLYGVLMHGQQDAAKVRQAFLADGTRPEEVQAMLQRIEPLRLAHRIDPQRLWLFSGRFDDVVPPKHAHALAEAAGLSDDHHIRLLATHYSGIIFLPAICDQICQQIQREAP